MKVRPLRLHMVEPGNLNVNVGAPNGSCQSVQSSAAYPKVSWESARERVKILDQGPCRGIK